MYVTNYRAELQDQHEISVSLTCATACTVTFAMQVTRYQLTVFEQSSIWFLTRVSVQGLTLKPANL